MRVAIIGGGLVGTCCGIHLIRGGAEVTIFDPEQDVGRASVAHVGSISTGSIFPLAGPGLVKQLIQSVSSAHGLMRIGLKRAVLAAPWLLEFLRQGQPDRVARSIKALAPMMAKAFDSYAELLAPSEYSDLFRREGQLHVYEDVQQFSKDEGGRRIRREHGINFEILQDEALTGFEPRISPGFTHGVLYPDAGNITSPARLLDRLRCNYMELGGALARERVSYIQCGSDGRPAIRTRMQALRQYDKLVIAAGAWSPLLAAMIGVHVPIESIRGYSVDFESSPLRLPTFFPGLKIFATPMEHGLRVSGIADIVGLRSNPDKRRAASVVFNARRAIDGLDEKGGIPLMGHRPTTPDSVPIISRSRDHRNILLVAGHGQIGLMTAAISGQLAGDLLFDRPPVIDPAPYRLDRF